MWRNYLREKENKAKEDEKIEILNTAPPTNT
jgi:hypothetical protein